MSKMKGSTQTAIRWTLLVVIAAFIGLCVLLGIDAFPKLVNAGPQEWVFLICLVAGGMALSYVLCRPKGSLPGT